MCNLILSSIGPKGRYPLVSIAIPFIACGLFGWFFPSIFNWVYRPSPEQTANLSFLAFKFVLGVFFIAAFVHLPPVRTYLMAVPHNVRRLRQRRSMSRSAPDRSLSAFWGDRRGNFAILTALMMVPILFSAGLAVEYTLTLMQRQRMTNALDAAVLAAGREITANPTITDRALKKYVEHIFIANLELADLNGSAFSLEEKDIKVDRTNQHISAKASHETGLRLIKAASRGKRTNLMSSNRTRVAYGPGQVEIALVLDVTDSMIKHIPALKRAANRIIDILLTDNQAGNVRISLVPYSNSVNVGTSLAKYVYGDYVSRATLSPSYDAGITPLGYNRRQFETDWINACYDSTDYSTQSCDGIYHLNWHNADGLLRDTCATVRKRNFSDSLADGISSNNVFSDANPAASMIPRDPSIPVSGCPNVGIVQLTTNESTLKTAVNQLTGGELTTNNVGLEWGWYTISHNWRDYLDPGSKPKDPSTTRVKKYIVWMSDGSTVVATAYSASGRNIDGKAPIEYWITSLCDAIKSNDIEIFTIEFKSQSDETSWCASPDANGMRFEHAADTGTELESTFADIGMMIKSRLRVDR